MAVDLSNERKPGRLRIWNIVGGLIFALQAISESRMIINNAHHMRLSNIVENFPHILCYRLVSGTVNTTVQLLKKRFEDK